MDSFSLMGAKPQVPDSPTMKLHELPDWAEIVDKLKGLYKREATQILVTNGIAGLPIPAMSRLGSSDGERSGMPALKHWIATVQERWKEAQCAADSKLCSCVAKCLVIVSLGCGGATPNASAASSGFACGKEFVLFSNDGWQSLARSTLDGTIGEPMYELAWGKKLPIELVNGGLRYFCFESVPGQDDKVTLYDTRMLKTLAAQRVPANAQEVSGIVHGQARAVATQIWVKSWARVSASRHRYEASNGANA